MNCLRVKDHIKAYIDGESGLLERWQIAHHIARCTECRKEMEIMTDMTNDVKSIPSVPAPSDLRAKVLGRLEFKPAAQPAGRWPYKTRPIETAFVLLVVVAMAALLYPVMNNAKMPRHSAKAPVDILKKSEPLADYSAPAGAPPPAHNAGPAPTPKMPMASKRFREKPKGKADSWPGSYELIFSSPAPAKPYMPQLIIKTADLSLQVKSFREASNAVTMIVKSEGGYITDSGASSESGSPREGTVTLRVPADRFERTVERLCALGKIKARNLSGKDVTGEVVDLESRLRNKRAEEKQYLQIMNGAKRIPDIVTVTNELSRVRGEIEEAEGQLKYLRSSASMSTINLTLSEKAAPKPKPAPQSGLINTFHDAVASLSTTGSALASVLIWLAVYSPVWGLPLLGIIYLKRHGKQDK